MPSPRGGKPQAASRSANASSRPPSQRQRPAEARKFYLVRHRVVSNASGFKLQNGKTLFHGGPPIFVPPDGRRGFRDYPDVPVFISDKRLGRIHWDFEEYCGYWFISDRMKTVLERLDPEAFAFLKCRVQLPDASDAPVRWFCDVVRVLDALDEEKSEIRIKTAKDGSKFYSFLGGFNLIFKEDVVGSHHIFRMKYHGYAVICDEQVRLTCKAAELAGPRFEAAWVKPIIHRS